MDPSFRWDDDQDVRSSQGCDKYNPCVYLLASGPRGTLYAGVTSDLVMRIWQHRNDLIDGFTRKHVVHDLAWFEQHSTMDLAITRDKAIKA